MITPAYICRHNLHRMGYPPRERLFAKRYGRFVGRWFRWAGCFRHEGYIIATQDSTQAFKP